MDKIVVIGGGGHAKVIVSVLKKAFFDVIGYTDIHNRGALLQIPFIGNDVILPDLIRKYGHCQAIVGIGKIDVSAARMQLQEEIRTLGFDFPVLISPMAVINEGVELDMGTAVLDGVVINSGTRIGRACILNTNSVVDHDCLIGDNVHIAPGATLSGSVTVGNNCMIGTGANIIQNISICDNCLIGAGATVVRDIRVSGSYVGNPAKKIK